MTHEPSISLGLKGQGRRGYQNLETVAVRPLSRETQPTHGNLAERELEE